MPTDLSARIGWPRALRALVLAVPMLFLAATGSMAQDLPKKVYLPNAVGAVSESLGAVIASDVSVALARHGIEALTYANLKLQLKEEQQKELLGCTDSGCVDELITNFGIADRIFCQVTRLGKDDYHVELSHFVKEKLRPGGKVSETVSCREGDLPAVATRLVLELLGLSTGGTGSGGGGGGGGGSGETVTPVAPKAEYVVTFDSEPPGAMVEVDGEPRKGTRCELYVAEGAHRVRMALPRYEPKEDVVVVRGKQAVSWELSPTFGWLDISSEPLGLKVRLSREGRGESQLVTTPKVRVELDPGRYRIEVEEGGYAAEWKVVEVEKGKGESVKFIPKQRVGYLKVKAFNAKGNAVAATVKASGRTLGEVPGPWLLQVGSYEVEVGISGYESSKEQVEIVEGKTVERVVKLEGETSSEGGSSGAGKAGFEWVSSKPAGLYFAKTETTVEQYRACVRAGACKAEHHKTKSDAKYCNWGYGDRDEHPMNCVDWYGAEQFCEWAGGRLPTEEEWSAEASDGGKREYPWGDREVTCDLAIWGDGSKTDGCGKDSTWPVCSKTAGNSVSGLCDMSGNVWEWTSSLEGSARVVRGGSWLDDNPQSLRAAARFRVGPGGRFDDFGVRCVRLSR